MAAPMPFWQIQTAIRTTGDIRLYFTHMFARGLTAAAIVSNALLGNLCMMPTAFAQGTPMPHEEHMEMVMTPMEPMSPAHCEHCAKIQSSDGDQSQQQSGCAGHCFSQAQNTTANAASFNVPQV